MREDEHGWDPKGTAQLHEMRGAVNSNGECSRNHALAGGSQGGLLVDCERLLFANPVSGQERDLFFGHLSRFEVNSMALQIS